MDQPNPQRRHQCNLNEVKNVPCRMPRHVPIQRRGKKDNAQNNSRLPTLHRNDFKLLELNSRYAGNMR